MLGIELGLMLGALASLAVHLWKVGHPHIAVVGRVPGTGHFRNVRRHTVEVWSPVLLVRPDESLNFANIAAVEEFIMAELAQHAGCRHLVLLGNAVNHIDVSALQGITQLIDSLRAAGVTLHLAEVKGPVTDRLQGVAFENTLAPGRIFFRVEEALAELAGEAPPAISRVDP